MRTFFQTLYFTLLVVIIFTLVPFIINDYYKQDFKELIGKSILLITSIIIVCIIISTIVKNINKKYKVINNTLASIYNHQINTHNKVLDGLSVVKESSKNILALDKIIKATERQGKVNQDTLSNQRDAMRYISSCIEHMGTVDREFLESIKNMGNLLSLINSKQHDIFERVGINTSLIKSDFNVHSKFLDIYKDNNNNLITIGEEFKNTNINLEIIKNNQKYLVDQLIISKGKTKGKK